jgi:hypothetical protein
MQVLMIWVFLFWGEWRGCCGEGFGSAEGGADVPEHVHRTSRAWGHMHVVSAVVHHDIDAGGGWRHGCVYKTATNLLAFHWHVHSYGIQFLYSPMIALRLPVSPLPSGTSTARVR